MVSRNSLIAIGIVWLGLLCPGVVCAAGCLVGVTDGLELERGGQNEAARAAYTRAVENDSTCAAAFVALGRLAAAANDWRAAERALAKARRLLPEDGALGLRLAEAYLAQDKYTWAVRTLSGLKGRLSDDLEAHRRYLLGVAAIKMGDATAADEHFAAIPETRRETYPQLAYYEGLSLVERQQPVVARDRLESFLSEEGRDRAFDPAARLFLERTYAVQGRDPLIAASLTASPMYDSNVLQQPDDQAEAGESPASFGLLLHGALSVNALRLSRHRFGVDLSLTRSFYFEQPAADYAYTGAKLMPRYRLRFRGFGTDQELHVGYIGMVSFLDGGGLSRDEENSIYVYSESHRGFARWVVAERGFGETALHVSSGRTLFHQQGRDNWGVNGALGQTFLLSGDEIKLFVEALGRYEKARRSDYSRWGAGAFVACRPCCLGM